MVTTLVTNPLYVLRTLLVPDKLRYALQILLPLAFLPLRRPVLALLLVPGCFFTLLTTDYAPTVEIFFHYSPVFVPYAFAGATLALAHIGAAPDGKVRLHAAAATLAVATLLATTAWGAFPPRRTLRSSYGWFDFGSPTAEQRQRRQDVDDLNAMVPKTAILAVSDREAPHVSNRYECWSLSAGFQGADYVLFSTVNPIAPDTEMAAAAERAGFVRIAVRSGLVLLARQGLSTGRYRTSRRPNGSGFGGRLRLLRLAGRATRARFRSGAGAFRDDGDQLELLVGTRCCGEDDDLCTVGGLGFGDVEGFDVLPREQRDGAADAVRDQPLLVRSSTTGVLVNVCAALGRGWVGAQALVAEDIYELVVVPRNRLQLESLRIPVHAARDLGVRTFLVAGNWTHLLLSTANSV